MQRVIVFVVALAVLIGAMYLVFTRVPSGSTTTTATSTAEAVHMSTSQVKEETDGYSIDARYPQFDISAVDEIIKKKVEVAIASFKEYPTDREADSVLPKNEQVVTFNSVYTGDDYISVGLVFSEYTGGAHPNSVIVGVNVDRSTGKEIGVEDALSLIGMKLGEVASSTSEQLQEKLGEAFFSDGATATEENYSTFLVDKNSVTFVFNSYQVGPYAAGPQEVTFARE